MGLTAWIIIGVLAVIIVALLIFIRGIGKFLGDVAEAFIDIF